jgi:hypothetical protein
MKHLLLYLLFLIPVTGHSQELEVLTSGNRISVRGLSVVSEQVIWASGNNGG